MIKLIYCTRRLPGLSLAEFQGHWLEHHCRYGLRNRTIRRYVQYHRLEDDPIATAMAQAGGSQQAPFDGVSISWWDDVAALRAGMASAAVAEAIEDEYNFIDHSRSNACLTTERVIVEPCSDVPYVLFECLHRRADLDRAAFSRLWDEHAVFGRRAHETGLLMGYIQNVTLQDGAQQGLEAIAGAESWDGIATAYYESIPKLKRLLAMPLAAKEAWEDECRFMDHARSSFFLTRRHVIRDLVR